MAATDLEPRLLSITGPVGVGKTTGDYLPLTVAVADCSVDARMATPAETADAVLRAAGRADHPPT